MKPFLPSLRPFLFALFSVCALSPLQAGDPVKAATDATVLVIVTVGTTVWTITGTHIYQANGSSAVFARLGYGGGEQRSRHESYQVAFREGDQMRLLPAERIGWTPEHHWLILRVRGNSLPPPPPLHTGGIPEAGTSVVLGCYAVPSFQPDMPPTPNIQRGTISNVIDWGDERDKARMLVIDREIGFNSIGGPVLDNQGRLVAFTSQTIEGTSTSRTIPLAPVWRYLARLGACLDLGYAQPTTDGWAVPCRVWSPLPAELQGTTSLGIVVRKRDDKAQQHSSRDEMPGMVWSKGGANGVYLLPVAPPELQLRHYVVATEVKYQGLDSVPFLPRNVVVNYRATQPATTPWLRPERTKP